MTLDDAIQLSLKIHGPVWLAVAAAYYRFGDRREFFEKAVRSNKQTLELIRDDIATELADCLKPIVTADFRVKSAIMDPSGGYIENSVEVTAGEPYYQSLRDYVSKAAGPLIEYGLIIRLNNRWNTWARRLSHSLLLALALEVVILGISIVLLLSGDPKFEVPRSLLALSVLPTALSVSAVLVCLAVVHRTQSDITNVRERYDPAP